MIDKLKIGDIYESCGFHPVLATEVDYDDDNIAGISLIDGTFGHSCSLNHCGVLKMTVDEALERKDNWAYKDDVNHPYWKKIYDDWGVTD